MSGHFDTVEAFYADDERRRWSPEWDYGVHWRPPQPWMPSWRVSWVVETGDLYAVNMRSGRVELLGVVPPSGEYPHSGGMDAWREFHEEQEVERVLAGWEHECGKPDSLAWVRRRLAERSLCPTCGRDGCDEHAYGEHLRESREAEAWKEAKE